MIKSWILKQTHTYYMCVYKYIYFIYCILYAVFSLYFLLSISIISLYISFKNILNFTKEEKINKELLHLVETKS
jgi:hypothetical protein